MTYTKTIKDVNAETKVSVAHSVEHGLKGVWALKHEKWHLYYVHQKYAPTPQQIESLMIFLKDHTINEWSL